MSLLSVFWWSLYSPQLKLLIRAMPKTFCSARIPISGLPTVLINGLVRHSFRFPAFPLYSWPGSFGTHSGFRLFHCTYGRVRSAQIPISGFSTVLMNGSVRHSFRFPAFPLYSWPGSFGTDHDFHDFPRISCRIRSAQTAIFKFPTVWQNQKYGTNSNF